MQAGGGTAKAGGTNQADTHDAKNMFYILNVEKLYAEMVAHIARGGMGSITDEWTMDGRLLCSLTEATRVWNSFELCPQEAQVAQEVVTVPWSRKVQDKRVQREVDARLEHITKKDESLESFMVWLLEVGQMAVELNSDRIKSPIYADTDTETVEDQDESTGSNSQSIQNS